MCTRNTCGSFFSESSTPAMWPSQLNEIAKNNIDINISENIYESQTNYSGNTFKQKRLNVFNVKHANYILHKLILSVDMYVWNLVY